MHATRAAGADEQAWEWSLVAASELILQEALDGRDDSSGAVFVAISEARVCARCRESGLEPVGRPNTEERPPRFDVGEVEVSEIHGSRSCVRPRTTLYYRLS